MKTSQALSTEELKRIEAAINDASKSITKEHQFKLQRGKKNHFLPPFETICQFFGVKLTPKLLLDQLGAAGAELPKISPSSLHEMDRNGVGRTVFKKFMGTYTRLEDPDILRPLYDFLFGHDEFLERAFNTNSNALHWLMFLNTFNAKIKHPDADLQQVTTFRYLMDFIAQRCSREVAYYESLKLKAEADEINLEDTVKLWETQTKPFYSTYTVVSEDALNYVTDLMSKKVVIEELTNDQKTSFIQYAFELEFDFLINAIACYEVGYVSQYYDPSDCKKWLISKVFDKYTSPENEASCFRCLMDVILESLEEHGVHISQQELASCVPYNPSKDVDEEDIRSAQYNKLYKWYRGIDLPSMTSIDAFFANLSELTQFPIDYGLSDVVRVIIGLDKTLAVNVQLVNNELGPDIDVFSIWKQRFSEYPKLYQKHCYQHEKSADRLHN